MGYHESYQRGIAGQALIGGESTNKTTYQERAIPFTPFHMGPGVMLKAVIGKHFSLTVFGFVQVAMDIEPLVNLLRGRGIVHGYSHTYLGAAIIGVIALVPGRWFCQRLLNFWKPDPGDGFMCWLRGTDTITWPAAIHAAWLGVFSHVLIDSLIHHDMAPMAPFVATNPLLGMLGFGAMHLLCLGIGVLGLLGLAVAYSLDSSACK